MWRGLRLGRILDDIIEDEDDRYTSEVSIEDKNSKDDKKFKE